MTRPSIPTEPDPRFVEFMAKSKAIEGERLASAIPRDYLEPQLWRGVTGFAMSWALYGGAVIAMAVLHRWYLVPVFLVIAGLGGWGLHCIAHDCGHGSFSRNRRLNFAIGHIALLPLAYPFHSWRHVHNLHHGHTNSLELDTDWRPIPEAVYRRMTIRDRLVYLSTRTWAAWAGTISYWVDSGFRPGYFPKREMRRDVRRSMAVVAAVLVPYLALLTWFTGWQGALLYFAAPWLATHAWFSITTLMHHSAADVPYLPQEHWTRNASRLLVTTDYMYPKWLLFLTHNISVHTAHHVAPVVPFYNLPKAQEALKAAYPGMVREERATVRKVVEIVRKCRFYDPISGLYATTPMERAGAGERVRS